jgi:hypothetical protein
MGNIIVKITQDFHGNKTTTTKDFKLSPWCSSGFSTSGTLHSVRWKLFTNYSEQTISYNFKGQAVQFLAASPFMMGPTDCLKILVTNYQSTMCNIAEE